jgi:hypothetical protein
MAGLVPAIHDFIELKHKTWMPANRAFTPVFDSHGRA